jgi:hypothetical protein
MSYYVENVRFGDLHPPIASGFSWGMRLLVLLWSRSLFVGRKGIGSAFLLRDGCIKLARWLLVHLIGWLARLMFGWMDMFAFESFFNACA